MLRTSIHQVPSVANSRVKHLEPTDGVRTAIEELRLHAGESHDPRVAYELRLLEARRQLRDGEDADVRRDLEETIAQAQDAGFELYVRAARDLLAEAASPGS